MCSYRFVQTFHVPDVFKLFRRCMLFVFYQFVSDVFRRVQTVQTCFQICFKLYQIVQTFQTSSDLFWLFSNCSRLFKLVHIFMFRLFQTFWPFQTCSDLSRRFQTCSICFNLFRLFKRVQIVSNCFRLFQTCSDVFRNVSDCFMFLTFQTFQTCPDLPRLFKRFQTFQIFQIVHFQAFLIFQLFPQIRLA